MFTSSLETNNREPVLNETIRDPLYRYMATVLQNLSTITGES